MIVQVQAHKDNEEKDNEENKIRTFQEKQDVTLVQEDEDVIKEIFNVTVAKSIGNLKRNVE